MEGKTLKGLSPPDNGAGVSLSSARRRRQRPGHQDPRNIEQRRRRRDAAFRLKVEALEIQYTPARRKKTQGGRKKKYDASDIERGVSRGWAGRGSGLGQAGSVARKGVPGAPRVLRGRCTFLESSRAARARACRTGRASRACQPAQAG